MERIRKSSIFHGPLLKERWAIHWLWAAAALALVALLIYAVPARYAVLSEPCLDPPCEAAHLSVQGHQHLAWIGLPISTYITYSIITETLVASVFLAVGAIIIFRKPDSRFAVFAAFMLLLFGLGTSETINALDPGSLWLRITLRLLNSLGFVSFFVACYLFPDGQFSPRWTKTLAVLWILVELPWIFPEMLPLPEWVSIPLTLGLIASCLFAQVHRFRHRSTPSQQQQTKWVIFGLFLTVSGFVLYGLLPILLPTLTAPGVREVQYNVFGRGLIGVSLIMFPLTLSIAIWRYHLWDIDRIISRTLIYLALTIIVGSIYILIVATLGALFQAQGNWFISLIAAGTVTVLFQPLRLWVQRGVNRMMFGDRDDPAAVLTQLARMLEAAAAPGDVPSTIVVTIAQALRIPYAVIQLQEEGEPLVRAVFGKPQETSAAFPLVYQGEVLGQLLVASREPGETLSAADKRLLQMIAQQAGPAIYALKLTTHLQRARERLVGGREEERRRIRRDLHDGLGPLLASQSLLLDSLSKTMYQDASTAEWLIAESKRVTQSALFDIRQIIHNLRPPSLDDLGLVGALQEEIDPLRSGEVHITILADTLPALPAAVEVAIYRIVQEAVTNVIRHADARICIIRLYVTNENGKSNLAAEIQDDGCGIKMRHPAGVGLESMQERAAELGGVCRIETKVDHGTTVWTSIPLDNDG